MKLTKSMWVLLGCCTIVSLITGCGSIMCGRQQNVVLDSRPTGAEVLVYDARGEIIFQKTTPCVASLPRRDPDNMEAAHYVVLVRKEGYAPMQFPLAGSMNWAYLANILNGGIGYAVDPMTGGMWTLTPGDVDAKLVSEHAAFFNKKGVTICLKEEVPQALAAYLRPVNN